MIKKYNYYACDFETTVYEGQQYTEVWAAAWVKLYTEDVHILGSLPDFLEDIRKEPGNICLYFHNLKFDGEFILYHILKKTKLKRACIRHSDKVSDITWVKDRDMPSNSYKVSISDKGQWYMVTLKLDGRIIEIRDSLKLMPMSLADLGDSFKTKHRKLEMEYKGFRYAGCPRTAKEDGYIGNDVLVLKEALERMFSEGHNKLTIGSCCMSEFRSGFEKEQYAEMFPNLYDLYLENGYHYDTVGAYILATYRGAWCYVNPDKQGRVVKTGITVDVNSLYPYVMHSKSGFKYPIGLPTFWKGNYIPDEAYGEHKVFFLRFRCRFVLKAEKLPTVQIKRDLLYKGNEWLTTSDVMDPDTGEYTDLLRWDDHVEKVRPTLSMTYLDWKLFNDHYHIYDLEILDGCWFRAISGIFDEYIDKYKQIKITSTGAIRTIAKLFSNNLYGKMASNTNSSFKVPYIKDTGEVGYMVQEEWDKEPGYIPCGSLITAAARYYTISHAQANYHGPGKRGFCYADTDSLHCDLLPVFLTDIDIHPTEYGCWKQEATWDQAIFVRQKTYIEHVVEEDQEPCEAYHNIKCAGMPDRCKKLLGISLDGYRPYIGDDYSKEQMLFIKKKRDYTDFGPQMDQIPGKLVPKHIPGGIVLTDVGYKMRDGLLF